MDKVCMIGRGNLRTAGSSGIATGKQWGLRGSNDGAAQEGSGELG